MYEVLVRVYVQLYRPILFAPQPFYHQNNIAICDSDMLFIYIGS